MKLNKETIILIVVSVILIGIGYWFISSSGSGNEPPISADTTINEKQVMFETLARELEPITFDTTIFEDARFKILEDIMVPLAQESSGRLDPFAPIFGVSNE